ncbi:MAG: P-loop NTPase [Propionibacteriaceae bacterium]|nr:P-loop NTPase [Propionibacteriaceae bacterium]
MQRELSSAILVSADSRLVHMAQASAAAIGVTLTVVADPRDLRTAWRTASAVLIGADQAGQAGGWALPRRAQVYLVGQADAYEALCRASMPLGASVIVVPEGAKWLSRVIAGKAHGGDGGSVVAVKPGAGGVGASTLCVSLAVMAARQSRRVALVDGDPHGGGIDLLLGAENTPGWRWDKLRNAVGQIADIAPMLPRVEGVTVVSMDRASGEPVDDTAYEAVIDCLARSHDLVLVDQGRGRSPAGVTAQRTIVVSTQTVRSLAATRATVATMDRGECALVVRRGGAVLPADAARAVDLPLIGVVPTVPELARLADRGMVPWLAGGWTRACSRILPWCLGEPAPRRGL